MLVALAAVVGLTTGAAAPAAAASSTPVHRSVQSIRFAHTNLDWWW